MHECIMCVLNLLYLIFIYISLFHGQPSWWLIMRSIIRLCIVVYSRGVAVFVVATAAAVVLIVVVIFACRHFACYLAIFVVHWALLLRESLLLSSSSFVAVVFTPRHRSFEEAVSFVYSYFAFWPFANASTRSEKVPVRQYILSQK